MRGILIGAACMAMALSTPIAAQEQAAPTLDQQMARFLTDAIANSQYDQRGDSWSVISSRTSSTARWHLYSTEDDDPRQGVHRNGWISAEGWNASATACGDEDTVHALALKATFPRVTVEELIAALSTQGAIVEFTEQDAESGRAAITHYNRGPRTLRWSEECTSPYSAAAQRCWTHYTLELTPSPIAAACSVAGR